MRSPALGLGSVKKLGFARGTAASAVLLLAMVLLPAPLPAAADASLQDGKLHLFFTEAPTTLNPLLSERPQDLAASRIVYEPLAGYDAEGRMVPFLAADIPTHANGGLSADGRRVTWTLKKGVLWADGRPFTAADVVFTYHYIVYSPAAAGRAAAYSQIRGIEALDDHRVKITFKNPQADWQQPFVGSGGMILPRHVFAPYIGAAAADAEVNLQGIGTGPYRAVSFTGEDVLLLDDKVIATTKVIYEPNPYFRERDKPAFSVVELQGGGSDSMIAAKAAETGLTDFAWNLADNPLALKLLSREEGQAAPRSNSWVEGLTLAVQNDGKTARGPAGVLQRTAVDWRLRQALLHCIDREAVMEIYRAAGYNAASGSAWQPAGDDSQIFDLSRAKQQLSDLGWVDADGDGLREKAGQPLKVHLPHSSDPLQRALFDSIAANFRAAGVAVGPTLSRADAFFGPLVDGAGWGLPAPALAADFAKLPEAALFQPASFPSPASERSGGTVIPLVMFNESAAVNKSLAGVVLNPWASPVWNIKDWHRG